MTKAGIERNLEISPYEVLLNYGKKNIVFKFASSGARDKFILGHDDFAYSTIKSLEGRFGFRFAITPEFLDVVFYRRTERRGFCIYINGVICKWPGELEISGTTIVANSSYERSRITTDVFDVQ